ncbi:MULTISPECIES: MFS transporter [unclassified Microbacterium]|uniref:MFS transporter n=1 Tax=unclassified Microbacterium TaxID=2609290 RepID=UPI00109D349D|nr:MULTISPECIES: MFS transporter [unclassified Microbacterium]
MKRRRRGGGDLLRRFFISRSFALLWAAQALSSFAEYCVAATATVWIVTDLGAGEASTPQLIALMVAAVAVPRLILAPFAGVWVDRWNAKRVMISSDLTRAAIYLIVVGIAVSLPDQVIVITLVVAQLAASISSQFFDPGRNSMMQIVIPQDRRADAAGRSMFASMGVGILATVSGPVVYAVSGPVLALTLSTVCLLVSTVLVRAVPIRAAFTRNEDVGYWRSLRDGLSIAWRDPGIRLLIVGMGAYGLSLGTNNVSLALFALETMGLSPAEYGVVSGMFSVGGLIGAVFAPSIVSRFTPERLFPVALISLGLTYIGYSFLRAFVPAAITMGLAGLLFSLYIVCQGPILQAKVPMGAMGRVSALTAPILAVCSLLATAVVSQVFASLGPAGSREAAYATAIAVSAAVMSLASLMMIMGRRRTEDRLLAVT